MNCTLYALLDPSKNVRYIGYTTRDPEIRLRQHLNSYNRGRDKHSHRCRWIKKLVEVGQKPTMLKLVQVSNIEQAKQLEIELIKHYKSFCKLTNNSDGGDGSHGVVWSDESRKRASIAQKPGVKRPHVKWSEESRLKLRECRLKQPKKRFNVVATHIETGEELVFIDKTEAAKYIGCRPSSIFAVSCGSTGSVYGWKTKLVKDYKDVN